MLTTGKTYDFEGEILSPMGWVKILAAITVTGDTAFSAQPGSWASPWS